MNRCQERLLRAFLTLSLDDLDSLFHHNSGIDHFLGGFGLDAEDLEKGGADLGQGREPLSEPTA